MAESTEFLQTLMDMTGPDLSATQLLEILGPGLTTKQLKELEARIDKTDKAKLKAGPYAGIKKLIERYKEPSGAAAERKKAELAKLKKPDIAAVADMLSRNELKYEDLPKDLKAEAELPAFSIDEGTSPGIDTTEAPQSTTDFAAFGEFMAELSAPPASAESTSDFGSFEAAMEGYTRREAYGKDTPVIPKDKKPTLTTQEKVNMAIGMAAVGLQGYVDVAASSVEQESLTMKRGLAEENANLSRMNQDIIRSQGALQQINIRRAGAQASGAVRTSAAGGGIRIGSGVVRGRESQVKAAEEQASISAATETERKLINERARERSLLRQADYLSKGVKSLRRGAALSTLGTIGNVFSLMPTTPAAGGTT